MREPEVLTGVHFWSGNDAAAEGLIAAGVRFFAGYPITPSSELQERMAERLPKLGGIFIQMEDEIASLAACIGASFAGWKAATATSGPGFSLMQEHMGLAIMLEAPVVVVDVQRAGPSTGMPTYVGQGDVMQARWGHHGDGEVIALAPSSVQECFDLTVKAVNLAERFRCPVVVLMDECTSHMYEKCVVPPPDKIPRVYRKLPREKPCRYPYRADGDLVPPMPIVGFGYLFHTTGLTHDERGYPAMDPEVQERLVRRLCDKIRKRVRELADYESFMVDDAEVIVVSYGITARVVRAAVREARRAGMKVGMLRLRTIWPFPEFLFKELAGRVKAFVVAEINYGQIALEVERAVQGKAKVVGCFRMGGRPPYPDEVLDAIKEAFREIKR